jgi:hypothetical protein
VNRSTNTILAAATTERLNMTLSSQNANREL